MKNKSTLGNNVRVKALFKIEMKFLQIGCISKIS